MYDYLYSQYTVIGSFIMAFAFAYLMTPFFRMLALKFGYLDHPISGKKSHAKPIPLLGGMAIVFAFFTGVLLTTRLESFLVPIFLGATVLVLFGLIDDRFGMMPNVKLTGQLIAALIVIRMGIKVETIQNHYLALVFTAFWIVGLTNSFNLLDNLNGLSSGIAAISAVFFALIAWNNGQMFVATISLALAGACLGFLKHNFPKANIFMGDVGSMFLGFILACISIIGCWKTEKISLSLSLPLLILSYPIFDTTLVTIIRILEKRPVFIGGKDHSSHILASLGLKKRKAVLYIYLICMITGIGAYIMSTMNVTTAFIAMGITYIFLFLLAVHLIFVRVSKSRKNKKNHAKKTANDIVAH